MFKKVSKNILILLMIGLVGMFMMACENENPVEPGDKPGTEQPGGNGSGEENGNNAADNGKDLDVTAKEMVDNILEKVQQPALVELEEEMMEDFYYLDPALLDEFAIRFSMINIKANEIAIVKVKDSADIAVVEESFGKRAADVQKSFEQYLPDQYENSKNFKVVTKGKYMLFVISESADEIIAEFDNFFATK